jgi:hypothetical protein
MSDLLSKYLQQTRPSPHRAPSTEDLGYVTRQTDPRIAQIGQLQVLGQDYLQARIHPDAVAARQKGHRALVGRPWSAPVQNLQGVFTLAKWQELLDRQIQYVREWIFGREYEGDWALCNFEFLVVERDTLYPAGHIQDEKSSQHGLALMEKETQEWMLLLLQFVDQRNGAPIVYKNGVPVQGGETQEWMQELLKSLRSPPPVPTDPSSELAHLRDRLEAAEARSQRLEARLMEFAERSHPPVAPDPKAVEQAYLAHMPPAPPSPPPEPEPRRRRPRPESVPPRIEGEPVAQGESVAPEERER